MELLGVVLLVLLWEIRGKLVRILFELQRRND